MEEIKTEEAAGYFKDDYNCCQAIVMTYGPDFGLSKDIGMRLGTGFGGGIARHGEVCGAATGAIIVLGLKYGMTGESDDNAREETYEQVGEFINKFKILNGSIRCRDLLNCNISTLEGRQIAKERDLFNTLCPRFVKDAAEILEEMLY
ncbi:MAG: C_GCAxxG_C_C family protein [Thermoplasmata archaeon]|nr:MAG: C_GCAxxG_C_C family protein [Thermoplasmata archaeon]UCF08990.1 MAG: C_GCAxxG_C_C family protein [Thermoplasmata archaeon]